MKGVLAVTGALQSGALSYARSKGIGVARILPDDQVQWMMHLMTSATPTERLTLNPSEFFEALTQPTFVGCNRNFYAETGQYIFGDWYSLLRNDLSSERVL